ncbi:MAG: ThiF family adenylyltransferase [Pyrinomonadaceae bacterium]
MNIRITEQDYKTLRRSLRSSFVGDYADEVGCILLVGENRHPQCPALLVREVLVPEPDDLAEQSGGHLTFSAGFLRRAMLRVRKLGLAGFLTVHTHPCSYQTVAFSSYDNDQDPRLMRNLHEQQPTGVFGSIVAGMNSLQGRVWQHNSGEWLQLETLVIVGELIRFLPLTGSASEPPPTAPEIFDRSLALTGNGALAELSKMRVAFVGASGTGSLAVEAAHRCGIREIVIFEFDLFDETNLGRVLHSRRQDAKQRRAKSERLKEVVEEADLGCRVTLVEGGDVTIAKVARELTGVDVIVGCVDDSHWARLVMSEVAYQYLIPYIDVGTEIGLDDTRVQSLDTRISYTAPGRPCLMCSRIVDVEQVRLEGLSSDERERVIAMGYSRDKRIEAPAVMELNMLAVGYGMLVLRHLLQPFLDRPIPTHIKGAVTNYSMRPVDVSAKPDCIICGEHGRKAMGDGYGLTVRTVTIAAGHAA